MNLRAYLRKMAVDGYVVQLDMSSVVELVKLLRSISSNVNQIARRCNSTRNLYAQDVEDLRQGYMVVWQGISELLKKFESPTESGAGTARALGAGLRWTISSRSGGWTLRGR